MPCPTGSFQAASPGQGQTETNLQIKPAAPLPLPRTGSQVPAPPIVHAFKTLAKERGFQI